MILNLRSPAIKLWLNLKLTILKSHPQMSVEEFKMLSVFGSYRLLTVGAARS